MSDPTRKNCDTRKVDGDAIFEMTDGIFTAQLSLKYNCIYEKELCKVCKNCKNVAIATRYVAIQKKSFSMTYMTTCDDLTYQ